MSFKKLKSTTNNLVGGLVKGPDATIEVWKVSNTPGIYLELKDDNGFIDVRLSKRDARSFAKFILKISGGTT